MLPTIGLTYLLARATDTIADTVQDPALVRPLLARLAPSGNRKPPGPAPLPPPSSRSPPLRASLDASPDPRRHPRPRPRSFRRLLDREPAPARDDSGPARAHDAQDSPFVHPERALPGPVPGFAGDSRTGRTWPDARRPSRAGVNRSSGLDNLKLPPGEGVERVRDPGAVPRSGGVGCS